MPTYEYRCLTCDERFERRTSLATADEVVCELGHHDVKRLLSAFAVSRGGTSTAAAVAPSPVGGAGCCGGGCGCG